MELSNPCLNEQDLRGIHPVEVNLYYRFYHIFKDLCHPEQREFPHLTAGLVNMAVHLLAENDVLSGIRTTAELLRAGKIVICSPCRDAIREFGLYCWDTSGTGGDRVVKSNDHAMDDIRYFAATVAAKNGGSFFAGSVERASI